MVRPCLPNVRESTPTWASLETKTRPVENSANGTEEDVDQANRGRFEKPKTHPRRRQKYRHRSPSLEAFYGRYSSSYGTYSSVLAQGATPTQRQLRNKEEKKKRGSTKQRIFIQIRTNALESPSYRSISMLMEDNVAVVCENSCFHTIW